MAKSDNSCLTIDLNHFKLHLRAPEMRELSLHFDTPSRRFYLSVIAFVVHQMRHNGGRLTVPLTDHAETLALLNQTVGHGAGSSTKRKLLPRIYNKWKGALPDLENAPLFKVVGMKKGYDNGSGRTYAIDDRTQDAWANLFEYRGSRDKVSLRFSVEKLGIDPKDVVIVFGNESDTDGLGAWDRFAESLRTDGEDEGQRVEREDAESVDESLDIQDAVVLAEEDRSQNEGIGASAYAAACTVASPQTQPTYPWGLSEQTDGLDAQSQFLPANRMPSGQVPNTRLDRQKRNRWLGYGAALTALLGLVVLYGIHHHRVGQTQAAKKHVYDVTLPKIRQLLEDEAYVAAYPLCKEAERIIPHDPTLAGYIENATNTLNIQTAPPGARIAYRPYSDVDGPWIDLGVTPIPDACVPVGMLRWRIQKEGYEEREVVRAVTPRGAYAPELEHHFRSFLEKLYHFDLYEKGRVPEGMLPVDRGQFIVPIPGLPANKTTLLLDYYFIDQTEVTNQDYKEFVDAGGYRNPAYWKEAFKRDGKLIPWSEAMKSFVDRTGRPGPATWELDDYSEGQDDYPVSGVSWYEAAAYARFRAKSLPTIYHWARAAFPIWEIPTPLTPHIVRQSNIEGTAVSPVGRFPGIGSSGAKDMAGNVREWCWNAVGEQRYCQGGMWQDATYMFNNSVTPSAWDRSPGNGFRCVVYPEDAPVSEDLLKETALGVYDPYTIPPCTRESFEAMKAMIAYERSPLHPAVKSRSGGGRGWRRETVTIDAAYNQERLIIHLDLPANYPPPYKTVIYFPGGNALYQPQFGRNDLWEPWDAIPRSGRALISPIYSGTYERGADSSNKVAGKSPVQWFSEIVNDLRRAIDYLETRDDIDTSELALLGVCWGGVKGPVFALYEDRIKSLILVSGCIRLPVSEPKPQGLLQPLLTIPVLMLNGKYDYVFPLETHQKPLFDLIGTPPEHKKHVIYETGHLPLPRAPMLKEIFAWLDTYQGPVPCDGRSMTNNVVEKGDSLEVSLQPNRR